ncbi:MAG: hypothetical protein OXN26_00250 [Gammaproteobacteria bacterium]|nr:hypothetical protein [Gammaproteobacteria bacterium]
MKPLAQTHADADDGLVEAIIRFNFEPVSWCHPSWWPDTGLPVDAARQLVEDPLAAAKLSKKMLCAYGLAEQFDYDFKPPFKRVALLSWRQQRRVTGLLGLAVYREQVAGVISARQQRRLLDAFGPADYALALRLELRHKFVSGAFLPALPVGNLLRCRVLVYAAGLCLLTNMLQAEADAYKRRFYFTWPKPLALKRLAARHGAAHRDVRRWADMEDYALYCGRQLNDPALIDAGRKLLGTLLSLQGHWE